MKQCPECGRIANDKNLPNEQVKVAQEKCGKCEESVENRDEPLGNKAKDSETKSDKQEYKHFRKSRSNYRTGRY